jgi:hypothetical protein
VCKEINSDIEVWTFHVACCKSRSVYHSIYRLADHVRSHTQEKLVGCPTCGGFFANREKFSNYCARFPQNVSYKPLCTHTHAHAHTHTHPCTHTHTWQWKLKFKMVLYISCMSVKSQTPWYALPCATVFSMWWCDMLQCEGTSVHTSPSIVYLRNCCRTTCITMWATKNAPFVARLALVHHPLMCIFATDTWTQAILMQVLWI